MKFKRGSKGGGMVVEIAPQESSLALGEQAVSTLPEFRLKQILVPIDFSDCSKKALRYAIPFARQFEAEITLLNVIQYPVGAVELMIGYGQIVDESKKALDTQWAEIKGLVPSRTVLREGNPPVEIVRAATELDSDLIILSTHGHSGLAHVLLGSTAERVVRYAPCPVLVVREREHEFIARELKELTTQTDEISQKD